MSRPCPQKHSEVQTGDSFAGIHARGDVLEVGLSAPLPRLYLSLLPSLGSWLRQDQDLRCRRTTVARRRLRRSFCEPCL